MKSTSETLNGWTENPDRDGSAIHKLKMAWKREDDQEEKKHLAFLAEMRAKFMKRCWKFPEP